MNKTPVVYGNGEQTRDFIYVEDVVESAILAMETNKIGIFNVGTGKETNINTVLEIIKKEVKSDCGRIYKSALKGEQKRSCLDYSKAKTELGWEPKYSLEEGLKKTVEWFREKYETNF